MTPWAMRSQPPRIHIHSCAGTEAGSQLVPEPACGDGAVEVSASMCIPAMEGSWAEARGIRITSASRVMTHLLTGELFPGGLFPDERSVSELFTDAAGTSTFQSSGCFRAPGVPPAKK